MEEKYVDTYFFDSKVALEIALKKNKSETINPNVKGLQICYYNGEKLSNAPKNCIHLPIEEIYSYFITTNNRFPQFVSFYNTNFSEKDQREFNQKMSDILSLSIVGNNLLVEKYKKKIKKNKPNFSDKQLRVFIPACRETIVMQHISKNIAKSFESMGYKVKYCIQKTKMETCGALDGLKKLYKFNPHITVNINHLNNEYLHDDVFNFVWFQDSMPNLVDNSEIFLRKRDYIFHLVQGIKKRLNRKNIQSTHQPFCINKDIYKKRNSLKRANKLVFIGNSYKVAYERLHIPQKAKLNITYELLEIYIKQGPPSDKLKKDIGLKYNIKDLMDLGNIVNYVQRDMMIKNIIKSNLSIDFELYGYGWENDLELKPYYKGILKYGKDISKVYNNAKYALVTGGYIIQQRTLEASASGTIPVVLDVRENDATYDKKFDESIMFFRTPKQITELLNSPKKRNLKPLVESHSYKHLVKKIINCVEKDI